MEKKQADYFLRRVYKLLESDDGDLIFRLKKIRDEKGARVCGKCWTLLGVIHVDPRKELLPTTVHEALHMLYPEWSETKIKNAERGISHNMSERQYANLLVKLADYFVRMGFADRKVTTNDDDKARR